MIKKKLDTVMADINAAFGIFGDDDETETPVPTPDVDDEEAPPRKPQESKLKEKPPKAAPPKAAPPKAKEEDDADDKGDDE